MGLLGMLGSWLAPRAAPAAALDAAMARAIETVDPLLKAVSGHERRLAPAVAAALGHCERLAAAIPGPVAIDRRGFSADSLVHALFATPDDIAEVDGHTLATQRRRGLLLAPFGQQHAGITAAPTAAVRLQHHQAPAPLLGGQPQALAVLGHCQALGQCVVVQQQATGTGQTEY